MTGERWAVGSLSSPLLPLRSGGGGGALAAPGRVTLEVGLTTATASVSDMDGASFPAPWRMAGLYPDGEGCCEATVALKDIAGAGARARAAGEADPVWWALQVRGAARVRRGAVRREAARRGVSSIPPRVVCQPRHGKQESAPAVHTAAAPDLVPLKAIRAATDHGQRSWRPVADPPRRGAPRRSRAIRQALGPPFKYGIGFRVVGVVIRLLGGASLAVSLWIFFLLWNNAWLMATAAAALAAALAAGALGFFHGLAPMGLEFEVSGELVGVRAGPSHDAMIAAAAVLACVAVACLGALAVRSSNAGSGAKPSGSPRRSAQGQGSKSKPSGPPRRSVQGQGSKYKRAIAATAAILCLALPSAHADGCPFGFDLASSPAAAASPDLGAHLRSLQASKGVQAGAEPLSWGTRVPDRQGYDGYGNNALDASNGAAGVMRRAAPATYSDGFGRMEFARPNPVAVSEAMCAAPSAAGVRDTGDNALSDLVVFFGQHISHEIAHSGGKACPIEALPIPNPGQARIQGKVPFQRTRFVGGKGPNSQREQLSAVSAFIDGSAIYGNTKAHADKLRAYEGGRLATLADGAHDTVDPGMETLPRRSSGGGDPGDINMVNPVRRPDGTYFELGNNRGNESPGLLTLQVMWVREHNRHAGRIAAADPDATDEEVYQAARRWTIATQQRLTLEYLSVLGIDLGEYAGYDPTVDARVANEFATAAMRFGHSMVSPMTLRGTYVGDSQLGTGCASLQETEPLRLCSHFFSPEHVIGPSGSLTAVLRGVIGSVAQAVDTVVVDDLRTFLFSPPFPTKKPRMDLVAVNIQRGRDHGLADFNTVRQAYGLPAISSALDVTSDAELAQRMNTTYGGRVADTLDLFIGGLAEDHASADPGALTQPTAKLGPTFKAIIKDQFRRVRDGDSWWYERPAAQGGYFDDAEIQLLHDFTMADFVALNGDIRSAELRDAGLPHGSPFYAPALGCSDAQYDQLIDAAGECLAKQCGYARNADSVACNDPGRMRQQFYDYGWGYLVLTAILAVSVVVAVYAGFRRRHRSQSFWLTFVPQAVVQHLGWFQSADARAARIKGLAQIACSSQPPTDDDTQESAEEEAALLALWMEVQDVDDLDATLDKLGPAELWARLTSDVVLDRSELAAFLGVKLDNALVCAIFRVFDEDESGELSFAEWRALMRLIVGAHTEKGADVAFALFDRDGNGDIDAEEFASVLRANLRESGMDETAVERLDLPAHFAQIDVDMSGSVCKDEFCALLESLGMDPKASVTPGRGTALESYLSARAERLNRVPMRQAVADFVAESTRDLVALAFQSRKLLLLFGVYLVLLACIIWERLEYYYQIVQLRWASQEGVPKSRVTAQLVGLHFAFVFITKCSRFLAAVGSTPVGSWLPLSRLQLVHNFAGLGGAVVAAAHMYYHFHNFYYLSEMMTPMLNCWFGLGLSAGEDLTFAGMMLAVPTLTTGHLSTVFFMLLLAFALPAVRAHAYGVFLWVHYLSGYILVTLLFLHGSIELVQEPHFWYFMIGPLLLYTHEKLHYWTAGTFVMVRSRARTCGRASRRQTAPTPTPGCQLGRACAAAQVSDTRVRRSYSPPAGRGGCALHRIRAHA